MRRAGHGIHIDFPERSAHLGCDEIGVTLTQAECVDLLRQLHDVLRTTSAKTGDP